MKLIDKAFEMRKNDYVENSNPNGIRNAIIHGDCPQEHGISAGQLSTCEANGCCEECWNREWTYTLTQEEHKTYMESISLVITEEQKN